MAEHHKCPTHTTGFGPRGGKPDHACAPTGRTGGSGPAGGGTARRLLLLSTEPEPSATADGRPGDVSASPSPDLKETPKTPPLPAALTSQRPDWQRCEAPRGGSAPGSAWRCTSVEVPLDYAKPTGETISIALIRKQARDKDRRIGSMLFNFGGPGGSAWTYCRAQLPRTGSSTPATTWWASIRAGWRPAPG
ncbi:hypothetical protein SMICM304S_06774 [Streptomyces microflavus]